MADPVSFSASLITVISTAAEVIKWIGKIREKNDAKTALLNEVTDLKVQLHGVERCGSAPEGLEQQMQELLDKARNALTSIENSLNHSKGGFRGFRKRLDISELEKQRKVIRNIKGKIETIYRQYFVYKWPSPFL